MGIFSKSKAEPAQAVTSEEQGKHAEENADKLAAQQDNTEADALEAHIEAEDPAAKAALELGEFRMSPGAKYLLDAGVDNLARSNGAGIDDPDVRAAIKQRSELIEATGNDLSIAIQAIVGACEDRPGDAPGAVYSLCYNVLKAAVFIANIDYRRYLDSKGDYDLWASKYVPSSKGEDGRDWSETQRFEADQRSEHHEAPVGCDDENDHHREEMIDKYGEDPYGAQFASLQRLYGKSLQEEADIFAASLEDLRYFFQLTCEAYGWDPERPMPFGNIRKSETEYDPINDAWLALDDAELKRKESRKRRAEREAARLTDAAARAREIVANALKR